jgi:pyruvate formate lyase activating enzyme
MPDRPLVVGGVTPFTTIDFPGRLAAVVFCQGCPWRCGYCHNPHLLPARAPDARPWADVLAWLETRRGLLDGVVFSGGEPLLQRGLAAAVSAVHEMGFAVALHTGGVYPERFGDVLPLLDWVGFDVKAPFDDYGRVTGAGGGPAARESLQALLASGRRHELRCTVDPALLDMKALARMAKELAVLGAGKLVLQACRRHGVGTGPIDPARIQAVTDSGIEVELRGA